MKRQIRRGVFETNSSSTHALCICSAEDYKKWQNGELLFSNWKGEFVPIGELTEKEKEEARSEYEMSREEFWADWKNLSEKKQNDWYQKWAKENLFNDDLYAYEDFGKEYERFTVNGQEVIAFGYYGWN